MSEFNNESTQQITDERMLSAWMDNVERYAENNIDTDSADDTTDYTDDGYTSEEDSEMSEEESESTEEYEIKELSPDEVVDICKVLDTDEYQEEIEPERVEMILNLIEQGAVVLDNTDPRYIEEVKMIKTFRNQRLTTDEIAAIIDLQEGREPACTQEVLENALEKVASGQYISFDYEPTEPTEDIEPTEDAEADDESESTEVTQETQTTTWWEWAFGTTQTEPVNEQAEVIESTEQPTEQPKQEGTGCIMM